MRWAKAGCSCSAFVTCGQERPPPHDCLCLSTPHLSFTKGPADLSDGAREILATLQVLVPLGARLEGTTGKAFH